MDRHVKLGDRAKPNLFPVHHMSFVQEVYTRRLSTMFGGGKERRAHRSIVIDFVVAGELASFRATERMSGLIQELPVHAADIFESG